MNKTTLETMSVRFSPELKVNLLALSLKEGCSVSEIIRRSLETELEKCNSASKRSVFNLFN